MKCNGCGEDIMILGGFFGYGDARAPLAFDHPTLDSSKEIGTSEHMRTLCDKCAAVIKNILLNSDLSDHWEAEEP